MSQHDLTGALARLLTDPQLRKRFREDRRTVAAELAVDTQHVEILSAIEPAQLELQAETLIRKRQSHVAQLVPATWNSLGIKAQKLFSKYVNRSAWPVGYKRHFCDAAAFCDFLQHYAPIAPAPAEYQWVAFVAGNRRMTLRLFRRPSVGCRPGIELQLMFRNLSGKPKRLTFWIRNIVPEGLRRLFRSKASADAELAAVGERT